MNWFINQPDFAVNEFFKGVPENGIGDQEQQSWADEQGYVGVKMSESASENKSGRK